MLPPNFVIVAHTEPDVTGKSIETNAPNAQNIQNGSIFTDETQHIVVKWRTQVTPIIVCQAMAIHCLVHHHARTVCDATVAIQRISVNSLIRHQVSFIDDNHHYISREYSSEIDLLDLILLSPTADPAANRKAMRAKKNENSQKNNQKLDEDDGEDYSDDNDEDPFADDDDEDDPDFLGGDLSTDDDDEESGKDSGHESIEPDTEAD